VSTKKWWSKFLNCFFVSVSLSPRRQSANPRNTGTDSGGLANPGRRCCLQILCRRGPRLGRTGLRRCLSAPPGRGCLVSALPHAGHACPADTGLGTGAARCGTASPVSTSGRRRAISSPTTSRGPTRPCATHSFGMRRSRTRPSGRALPITAMIFWVSRVTSARCSAFRRVRADERRLLRQLPERQLRQLRWPDQARGTAPPDWPTEVAMACRHQPRGPGQSQRTADGARWIAPPATGSRPEKAACSDAIRATADVVTSSERN
jgi:hypothetical protein